MVRLNREAIPAKNKAIFVAVLKLGKAIEEAYNKNNKLITTKQYAGVVGPILCKDQIGKFTEQQVNVLDRLIKEFELINYS